MIDPVSAGASTGLRMIWEGIKWVWRSRQAPWSALSVRATLGKVGESGWRQITIQAPQDNPYPVEILSVRTIRPSGLKLCRSDGTPMRGRNAASEAVVLTNLQWTIAPAGSYSGEFNRAIHVNLSGRKGLAQIDLELQVRLLNNRRTEIPVWVRTNIVDVP